MASKQVAFRFDEALLELVKEKAKAERRSLNNYIENLLYQVVGDIPNETTLKALKEANSNNLEEIEDLHNFLENV